MSFYFTYTRINNYLEGITDKFTYVSCDSPQVFVNASSDYLVLIIGSNGHVWDLNNIIGNSSDFGKYLAFELEETYTTSLNAIITMFGSHFIENPVTFDASNTTSEDGIDPVTNWAWDFNSDGDFDDYGSVVTFYFDKAGAHEITLRLSNEQSPAVIINQTIKIYISE